MFQDNYVKRASSIKRSTSVKRASSVRLQAVVATQTEEGEMREKVRSKFSMRGLSRLLSLRIN